MILYIGNDTGVQTLNTDCLPGSGSTPDFYLDTDLRHWFSTCIRILKTGLQPGSGSLTLGFYLEPDNCLISKPGFLTLV